MHARTNESILCNSAVYSELHLKPELLSCKVTLPSPVSSADHSIILTMISITIFLHLKALLLVLGVVGFAYYTSIIIYRLYLSPVARTGIPGPKLAAATSWYEFYYDWWLGGKYIFHIEKLHAKYGISIRARMRFCKPS